MTIVMVIYCCGFHTPNNILITNAGFSLVAAGQLYLGTNRLLRPWGGGGFREGGVKFSKEGGTFLLTILVGGGTFFSDLCFPRVE